MIIAHHTSPASITLRYSVGSDDAACGLPSVLSELTALCADGTSFAVSASEGTWTRGDMKNMCYDEHARRLDAQKARKNRRARIKRTLCRHVECELY